MGLDKKCGLVCSRYDSGVLNQITDVPGVSVGHFTMQDGCVQTGVTAVMPHSGNLFREKCVAAAHVINGFGKSIGLMQIQELGTIETPIMLTNTFSVGTVSTALIRYMLEANPDICTTTGSVNPVVLECNDGKLNDIRGMHITEEHARAAIEACKGKAKASSNAAAAGEVESFDECAIGAGAGFKEGAVGAGTGMMCYGLKGGIGSSSRTITVGRQETRTYTVGTLVMTNMGKLPELRINGEETGRKIADLLEEAACKELADKDNRCESSVHQNGFKVGEVSTDDREQGSIIVIIATDLPLSARQLGRVAKRAQNGIARTGSVTAGGSGEVVVCFSTANKVKHYPEEDCGALCTAEYLHEDYLDEVFAAVSESVEESIISSMMHADVDEAVRGKVHSLKEYI